MDMQPCKGKRLSESDFIELFSLFKFNSLDFRSSKVENGNWHSLFEYRRVCYFLWKTMPFLKHFSVIGN